MKRIFRIFASLSLIAAAVSCQQFEIDTQMTPEKFAQNVKLVSDALESYSIACNNPQVITFNVSANTPWTITGGAEWLTVTPASSSASSLISDVTVTAQPNETLEDRSATLTIKADDYETTVYNVTINQQRKSELFVLPISEEFTALGGELSFQIQANKPWKLRADQGWLSFDKTSGDASADPIIIKVTAEQSKVLSRAANVIVACGDEEVDFTVYQNGTFEITEIADKFSSAGEARSFSVTTDLPWKVSSDMSWLSFDKTEGEGDGSAVEIVATAAVNENVSRQAVITVKAGDASKSFTVEQKGLTFKIVAPAEPKINSVGGELIVEVEADLDWTVAAEGYGFSAEKVDATHFKASGAWNKFFKENVGTFTITSVSGGFEDSIELSQDCNFTFENCEPDENGYVKIVGADASKIYVKNELGLRMVNVDLEIGDKNFGDKAQFWAWGKFVHDVNIYNQLSLGGNLRFRMDGTMVDAGSSSAYNNAKYSITKDDLNAMDTYSLRMNLCEDPTTLEMAFLINGEEVELGSHSAFKNPFYHDHNEIFRDLYFGSYQSTSDGTWYVIKSCDIEVVAEPYL